jgi:hypothetical protein
VSHHQGDVCSFAGPGKKSPFDLLEAVIANWFILIRITRLQCAEYAQKIQSAFDEHEYPLGICVMKAFISTD